MHIVYTSRPSSLCDNNLVTLNKLLLPVVDQYISPCIETGSPQLHARRTQVYTQSLLSQPVDLSLPLTWAPGHSLPWWQSSYVNHAANQTVQQFVSPHPPTVSQPLPISTPTFHIRLIEGNISVCYGCCNKYQKNSQPLNNLCLQTEERREFKPASGVTQARFAKRNMERGKKRI